MKKYSNTKSNVGSNKSRISKTKDKKYMKKTPSKFNMVLFFTFIVGVVLIVSTYAWFSATLDAKVDFVRITVNRETGLYISLDGVEYGSEVTIDENIITNSISSTYPDHNNKWVSSMGLIPISSSGIPDSDTFEFAFFELYRERYSKTEKKLYLDFAEYSEDNEYANFVAFDLFLKNISNSPKADNLYLWEGTSIELQDGTEDKMVSLLNTVRLGISKGGHTSDKNASASVVQNLECENNCESVIYEPYSTDHNEYSINQAVNYGVDLVDGVFTPTYSLISAGQNLSHYTGHGLQPFDNDHFIFQDTIRNLNEQLFEIEHGVTKVRVYIWLEGQDIDALETKSSGDILNIDLVLHKDLAGYDL